MQLNRPLIGTIGALVLLAATAAAQDLVMDTDGDGVVGLAEFMTAMPDRNEADFAAIDVSGDGVLDADEIAVATEAGVLPASDG